MLSSFEPWMLWGAGLILALPVLFVSLGELADDAQLKPEWRAFTKPLLISRNGVVPLAFATLLLRHVAGLSGEQIAVKVIDTALWIIILNAAVAFMNVLLFDEDSKSSGRIQIPRLLLDILRFIFVVCGAAVTISTIWGVNLGSLITALGVGSVVIGLALQDTLGSLFAGIAMVSARQFRAGDWVKFGNDEGVIVSQNWRTVTIKTRMGDALIIPNGIIARAPITVITGGTGDTVLVVELRFPYQYSPDSINQLMSEAAYQTSDFILTPPPVARALSFEDNGIRYAMAVRAKDPARIAAVRSEYLINVWYAAQRRGVPMLGQYNTKYVIPPASMPSLSATTDELAARLRGIKDFAYPGGDLGPLLARASLERFRNKQVLVARGAVATHVYILLSGRVRTVRLAENGEELVLHAFEPGNFILSKATLRNAEMSASVTAAGDVEVVAIPIADFKAYCAGDLGAAHDFEQMLSAREDAAQRMLGRLESEGRSESGDRALLVRNLFK
jgi:small-conductance mechanosensitive channel/CRP-like cAMP-binding protein